MRTHGKGVHPGIGSARSLNNDLFPCESSHRFFQSLLHTGAMVLSLPTHIGRTIKFYGQRKTGHYNLVPEDMGLPRRNSSQPNFGRPDF